MNPSPVELRHIHLPLVHSEALEEARISDMLDMSSEYRVGDVDDVHRFLRAKLPEELVRLILNYLEDLEWWALVTCSHPHLFTMDTGKKKTGLIGRVALVFWRILCIAKSKPTTEPNTEDYPKFEHECARFKLRPPPIRRRVCLQDTGRSDVQLKRMTSGLPSRRHSNALERSTQSNGEATIPPKTSNSIRSIVLELRVRLQTPSDRCRLGVTAVRRPRIDSEFRILQRTASRDLSWPPDGARPRAGRLTRSSLQRHWKVFVRDVSVFWTWPYSENREWIEMLMEGDEIEFWVRANGPLACVYEAKVHLFCAL